MSIPVLTIVFMVLSMLIGIAIPIGLCLFFRKKYGCSIKAFWMGCGVMLLFAFVLEQIVHMVVLSSPIGAVIQGNVWLMALYGGLMAGLFEETGRFLAMRFLLKNTRDNDYNGLMYGAGHGGFEACYLLVLGMLNNLIYAVMWNTGNAQMLLDGLDANNQAVLQQALATLASTSPFMILISPLERVSAVIAQLSLSVLVWFAVKNAGSLKWYPIAIFLHFLLDFVAASLSGIGVPVMVIELVIFIMAIAMAFLAKKVWNREKDRR